MKALAFSPGGLYLPEKRNEMKLNGCFSVIVSATLLLCGCDMFDNSRPHSINITDASCIYKRSKVATKSGGIDRFSHSEGWFKINAEGQELPVFVSGVDGQEMDWTIGSVQKIGSRTLLINDEWFADMMTGNMYACDFQISRSVDYPPHFAEYSGNLYYSNYQGLFEINPADYSYRKILPDGQVSSYCVVDKDGMCVYINSGADSRIKVPSGRIIKVDNMPINDELFNAAYSEPGVEKNDWFEYDGQIYRLMCCTLDISTAESYTGQVYPGSHPYYTDVVGIYKYSLKGESVETERVACAYVESTYYSVREADPSLFIRKKNGKELYILKAGSMFDANAIFMFEFDGEQIARITISAGAELQKIVESLGMMDISYRDGPNNTMHYARKSVTVDSDPVFFRKDVIYKLNSDSGQIRMQGLSIQDEYDVYTLKQTAGSNTAQFTGMRFYDGAVVLGNIDENGNVTIIDETSSSYQYSYMQKIN